MFAKLVSLNGLNHNKIKIKELFFIKKLNNIIKKINSCYVYPPTK